MIKLFKTHSQLKIRAIVLPVHDLKVRRK